MFNGTPAPGDLNVPGFNTTKFIAEHSPNVTDPILATTIKYMRETLGIKKIGATGYCYGGRYAFRVAAAGKGADAAFAAHPSLLEDAEISAIKGPASVAAAGKSPSKLPAANPFIVARANAATTQRPIA
jgi:dienelactone hydrolase